MEFTKVNNQNIRYQLQNLRQLVFEVTDKCNLNCKYCTYSDLYNKAYDQRDGKDMPFHKVKLIIDYVFNLWKDNYSNGADREVTISFYGGEPLINITLIKQIIDYINNLEKVGRHFFYAMTTNAMLLDKYMDYLVEKEFQLLISLDGNEFAQSYRVDHTGKNSFEKVFQNVKLLQKTYPDYFQKKINFHSVLHNRNNVESIYQFIKKKFGKIPLIMPLNDSGICEEKKEEFKKMYQHPAISINQSKKCEIIESELMIKAPRVSELANYIQYQSKNVFNSYNDLFINNDKLDPPPTGTCIPFSKKMFITVNGKILPCERIDHHFSLGQILDNQILLNEEYVANQHNFYVSKYIKQCTNCATNRFCMQCVYQIDDIQRESTRCLNFLSPKELEQKNKNIFTYLQEYPHYYKRILEEVIIRG